VPRPGQALRPREHDTFQVRLTVNKRLTPLDYDRNIFHLEFDISGTGLTYQIGDALGVFGHKCASARPPARSHPPPSDHAEVDAFIAQYNATGGRIDPDSFLGFALPDGRSELVSARNLLNQHLDLFGKPSKKFYVWLAGFAASRYEHLKLLHTGTDDTEGFKLGVRARGRGARGGTHVRRR
jgi:sulfite reductase (NADPH) flavoprotein alpha-component